MLEGYRPLRPLNQETSAGAVVFNKTAELLHASLALLVCSWALGQRPLGLVDGQDDDGHKQASTHEVHAGNV